VRRSAARPSAAVSLLLAACGTPAGDDEKADVTGDDTGRSSDQGVTWHQHIAPLVAERCAGCHTDGGLGFDLTDPAVAVPLASAIAQATGDRLMPPWHATPIADCAPTRPWAHDWRLTDPQIALFAEWAAAGAPLGDPDTAAPLAPPSTESLAQVDHVLVPDTPYSSGSAADEFWCYSLDPALLEDTWVTGFEVVPDNRAIAHHALLFLDEAGESEALGGADGGYPCTGGAMTSEAAPLLATWIPGAPPTLAPEGAATVIPAGSRLVLQMHYHPSGEAGLRDATEVHLQTTPDAPAAEFRQALIGNAQTAEAGLQPGEADDGAPRFLIPAGAAAHVEDIRVTLADGIPALKVARVGAHMHYVGTELALWVERPTSGPECLLANPGWDFDWQRSYSYDVPLAEAPVVQGGDTIRVRCTYNNTLDHDGTRRALTDAGLDAPVDVGLGEGSLDEMCLAVVGYVIE
jgi:hypothetical protein